MTSHSNLFSNTHLICSVQWRYWDKNMGHHLLFSVTHPTPPTDSWSLTFVSQSFSQSFFPSYSHISSPNLKFLSCSCSRIGRRARGQGCNRIHTNNTCKLINISPVRRYLWCIMGRQLNRCSIECSTEWKIMQHGMPSWPTTWSKISDNSMAIYSVRYRSFDGNQQAQNGVWISVNTKHIS